MYIIVVLKYVKKSFCSQCLWFCTAGSRPIGWCKEDGRTCGERNASSPCSMSSLRSVFSSTTFEQQGGSVPWPGPALSL